MFAVTILKILSILMAIVGTSLLIPAATAVCYGEYSQLVYFLIPAVLSWVFCIAVYFPTKNFKIRLNPKMTFAVVALAWIATSLFGAIPLFTSGAVPSFTDGFFESASGFSTTGASIVEDVEILPKCMNMWRVLTHWLGGMGIVALTVALLPILGVGGFQLIKAETTGPEKGKVTPKITTTAKVLWIIYLAFTVIETILLMICGMDFYEALCHSFSTLGTGGFSTRNASIAAFNSPSIEVVITVFMFLSGVNFSLYYYIIARKGREIVENSEFKAYLLLILVFVLIISGSLFFTKFYGNTEGKDFFGHIENFGDCLRYAAFNVATIMSTTGFADGNYTEWAPLAQFFIFALFFIGGCSGSTAGGVKVIRWVVLGKQAKIDLKKMLHPQGVFNIRVNKRSAGSELLTAVTTFMTVYIFMVAITTIVGCFHFDLETSFTGAISMIGNVGPAFGELNPMNNYASLPDYLKWWYSFAMLAGRLELFTMIIFFIKDYWKK